MAYNEESRRLTCLVPRAYVHPHETTQTKIPSGSRGLLQGERKIIPISWPHSGHKKIKNKIQPTQIPCFGILESTTKEEEQIKIDVWLHGHNFKARKTDMHVYIPFDTVNSKHLAIQ